MNPYIIAERKEGSCEIEGVTEFCHPAFDRFPLEAHQFELTTCCPSSALLPQQSPASLMEIENW